MYSHDVGNSHVPYKPVTQEGKLGLYASKILKIK